LPGAGAFARIDAIDVLIGTRKSEVEGLPVGSPEQAVADADLVVPADGSRR
jgi:hypothetical protein